MSKKRSAIIIVCNGQPFIKPQLENIYGLVDEIIIMEGADKWFQQIIKSKRSTDGTIKTIEEFPDPDKKIQLHHVNMSKNKMVWEANKICTGDYIYQVDADEFMRPEHIEHAFELLKLKSTVQVPQRWYYKWTDVYMSAGRPNHIRTLPVRFFRNRVKEGLLISHIPCNGYYKNGKHIHVGQAQLPMLEHAYHYLAVFPFQIENKMRYYVSRDGANATIIKRRLAEFQDLTRKNVETGQTSIKSYNAKLLIETNPYIKEFK